MRIAEIAWTDADVEHIARHGITPDEVEEVVGSRRYLFVVLPHSAAAGLAASPRGRWTTPLSGGPARGRGADRCSSGEDRGSLQHVTTAVRCRCHALFLLRFAAILAASGTRLELAGMEGEVLAHLELHPLDLGEEPRRRQVVVRGIGLRLAEVGHLSLKMSDPF